MSSFAGTILFGRGTISGSGSFLPAWGGRGSVAFAGRLDDRPTLAAALDRGALAGIADDELARLAVERWQQAAPARLLGDFALAAWLPDARRLILAADPLGIRTVFYHRRNDGAVSFATSLRALLAMPDVPRALSPEAVADFLAQNYGDDETTFYRGVMKVRPGTAVMITADDSRTEAFHRFDPERRLILGRDQAYVEQACELLDRAVADRLRDAGPAIVFASGGLDSAGIAAAASACRNEATLLTAVPSPGRAAIAPRGRDIDEGPLVQALVDALPGLRAEFIAPAPDMDWNPGWAAPIVAGHAPQLAPTQIAWFSGVHRRAASLGARVCLSGDLGNRTLTWDGLGQLPGLFRRGAWLTLARELVLGSGGHPRRLASLLWHDVLAPLGGRGVDPARLADITGLRPGAIAEFDMPARIDRRGNDSGWARLLDSRLWRIRTIHRSRSRRPEIGEMLRGLYGFDSVLPMTDRRLVEFCLAIPEDQFLRNGTQRWLARRVLLAAGVPRRVACNPRRGYQHPEWFADLSAARPALPALIARLRGAPLAARLIDLDRLDHLVAADWPGDAVAAERRAGILHGMLPRALGLGAFIAWAEGAG